MVRRCGLEKPAVLAPSSSPQPVPLRDGRFQDNRRSTANGFWIRSSGSSSLLRSASSQLRSRRPLFQPSRKATRLNRRQAQRRLRYPHPPQPPRLSRPLRPPRQPAPLAQLYDPASSLAEAVLSDDDVVKALEAFLDTELSWTGGGLLAFVWYVQSILWRTALNTLETLRQRFCLSLELDVVGH